MSNSKPVRSKKAAEASGRISGPTSTGSATTKRKWRTPTWKTWIRRECAHLNEAIALSLNVDPRDLPTLKAKRPSKYRAFRTRLKSACLAAGKTLSIQVDHLANGPSLERKIVDLRHFVEFALSRGWGKEYEGFRRLVDLLPDQHQPQPEEAEPQPKQAAAEQEQPAPPLDQAHEALLTANWVTVQLPYVTKEMHAMFTVLKQYWTSYDEKRPPKQSEIYEAIDNALGFDKSGPASRLAQEIAAMIRPQPLRDKDHRANRRRGSKS